VSVYIKTIFAGGAYKFFHFETILHQKEYLPVKKLLITRGPEAEKVLMEDLKHILSKAFESLLGSNGVRVFRFHVERRLGQDMYDVFCEDPSKFYRALRDIFGIGAEPLMRLIARWLSENGYMDNLDSNEFVRLLKEGGGEAVQILSKSLKLPHQGDQYND